jgi:hypothetical protein
MAGATRLVKLVLAGDVMTGRGIDPVLHTPSEPTLHEGYVRDARDYVGLAERVNGSIGRGLADDAICHGMNGKGAGEMRRFLTTPPSNLTTIAKRNGGMFPNEFVWQLIDGRGRTEVGAHGTRAMRVWGQRFRYEALQQASTAAEPEWYVRNRIVALLDYLWRFQEK